MKTDNEGHLDVASWWRNREACQESARKALKHSEENRKYGNEEAAAWWVQESERCTKMAAFWREKAMAIESQEPVGNPAECDMR